MNREDAKSAKETQRKQKIFNAEAQRRRVQEAACTSRCRRWQSYSSKRRDQILLSLSWIVYPIFYATAGFTVHLRRFLLCVSAPLRFFQLLTRQTEGIDWSVISGLVSAKGNAVLLAPLGSKCVSVLRTSSFHSQNFHVPPPTEPC